MIIVIPAFQPDNRVLTLIHEIQENSDFGIILVNDGSAPKCTPVFESAALAGCIVLSHEVNKGKGAALKTAFRYLLDTGSKDGFICADCDGQHTWKDIKRLAEAALKHPSSIILGCRKFVGKVPMKSMLGNRITRTVFSIVSGNKISDTQTGLRGYSALMLPWLIQLKGNHYEFEMNQLLEAKEAGYSFCCIPIETIYEDNNKGSHFNPIKDSIRIYLPILKFCCSSLICGIIDFGLLFLLKILTDNLLLSVVGARTISSLTNYVLNKNLVFNAEKSQKASTILQYYLLVAVIMGCNYLLMYLFSETIGLSLLISKILTECLLFIFSYTVQQRIIFKDRRKNK